MTYLILLIWLLRLIIAFVVMTKIKDHIYYGTKLESRVKNTHLGWNLSLGEQQKDVIKF